MRNKKPRKTQVVLDFGTVPAFSVKQVARIDSVYVEVVYDRAKGPKALVRVPAADSNVQANPNKSLASFDFVVAVDTNTELVAGQRVSIAASVIVRSIQIEAGRWHARLIPQAAFEFHDATEPPEVIGWINALQRAQACPACSGRVALIVDSDLGRHGDYNARRQPLLDDFFLPKGIRLVYASSERGSEYIANKAIAYCDKTARQIIRRIKAGDAVAPDAVVGMSFRSFRYWPRLRAHDKSTQQ